MEPSVLLNRHDAWAEIILNRPDKLNAFHRAMHDELAVALNTVEEEADVRAILVTGAGRGFCTGQDLAERLAQPSPYDLGPALDAGFNRHVRRLRALRKPVVVAVNGIAAGAGANLALAGDLVLAARSAKFVQSFAKLGLIPDSGGTFFLPRLIGDARARGLALLAETITAEQAADWGLIWQCLDDSALLAEARALAARLAIQPTEGLALIKQALNASPGNTLDQQLDLERQLQQQAGRTPDYLEGLAAFAQKRAPKFTGRVDP